MNIKCFGLLVVSFCLFAFPADAQQKVHKEIAEVLKDIRAFNKRQQKEDSTLKHPLGSRSETSFARRYAFYQEAHAQLNKINSNILSFDDQVNLELLQHDVLDEIAQYKYKAYLNPILSDEGFHTSLARRGNTSISSLHEAEQYIILLKDIPRFVNENLDLMHRGLRLGISQPKVILQGYETTYIQHIVDTIEKSVFWKPFLQQPFGINDNDWNRVQTTARRSDCQRRCFKLSKNT